MHFLERAGERAIPRPRRRNFGQAEQRQRIATCELKQYAQDRRRGEQHIKCHVGQVSEESQPASEWSYLWRGRPINKPPNEAQSQKSQDTQSRKNKNEETR